jgi:hypothetical protein
LDESGLLKRGSLAGPVFRGSGSSDLVSDNARAIAVTNRAFILHQSGCASPDGRIEAIVAAIERDPRARRRAISLPAETLGAPGCTRSKNRSETPEVRMLKRQALAHLICLRWS